MVTDQIVGATRWVMIRNRQARLHQTDDYADQKIHEIHC